MPDDNVIELKNDQQKADAFREQLKAPLNQVASIMAEANRDGFKVGFNIAMDGFGRFGVQVIEITKAF